jgi:hypothetical protein
MMKRLLFLILLLAACTPTPQHIAISSLLPTATLVGWEATAPPSATSYPTETPMPTATAVVKYDTSFMVEVIWRGRHQDGERMVNMYDYPGIYYNNDHAKPSKILGYIRPYTRLSIAETVTDLDGNVWGKLVSQNIFIPLKYNGEFYAEGVP